MFKPEDLLDPLQSKLDEIDIGRMFPDDIREAVRKLRYKYCLVYGVFKEAIDTVGPHFDEVFVRYQHSECFGKMMAQIVPRIERMESSKQQYIITAITSIFTHFAENIHMMDSVYKETMKEMHPTKTKRPARKKKNTTKKKRNSKRGKGAGKKQQKRTDKTRKYEEQVEEEEGEEGEQEEEKDEEEEDEKKENEQDNPDEIEEITAIPALEETEFVPEELLALDYGKNRYYMAKLYEAYRDLMFAMLNMLELDLFSCREKAIEEISNTIGELSNPFTQVDNPDGKIKSLLDFVASSVGVPEGYIAIGREKYQCARRAASLATPECGCTDDREHPGDNEGILPCDCDSHGPCRCCCSGCYPIKHKEEIHKKNSREDAEMKTDMQECQSNVAGISNEETRSPIEHLDNSSTFQQNRSELDEGVNFPRYNSKGTENNYSDLCSHCNCDCFNGCNFPQLEMPDKLDFEKCSMLFTEHLKNFAPWKSGYLTNLITQIHHANPIMARQKIVEFAMPHCLKLLKECEVGFTLYLVEMFFKSTMSLTVARKYCYRDPEFWPAIARLLEVVDTCKNRDPNHLRSDGAYVLYISLMGSERENFVKISQTNIFRSLIEILYLDPKNQYEVQSAEDVFNCFALFTDEGDLFYNDFRNAPMKKLIDRWRKYAVLYTKTSPDFVWLIESFRKRLVFLYAKQKAGGSVKEQIPPSYDSEERLEHTRIACSNPACYVVNYRELTGKKYKKCSRCQLAYYCSRECQRAHHKSHKNYCEIPSWKAAEAPTVVDKNVSRSDVNVTVKTSTTCGFDTNVLNPRKHDRAAETETRDLLQP